MAEITAASEHFVAGLNILHGNEKTEFTATAGKVYDRIVKSFYGSQSVHAFVRREDGAVLKPAGWAAPAKGVRYTSVDEAIQASDTHGGYLYAK